MPDQLTTALAVPGMTQLRLALKKNNRRLNEPLTPGKPLVTLLTMNNATTNAVAATKSMKLQYFRAPFKVRGGDTLTSHVSICSDEALALDEHAKAEAEALRVGDTVIYDDGRRVWRETVAPYTFDADDPDGGPIYEWHADGDRCRHHRVEHTTYPDGRTEAVVLRRFWRVYE